MTKRVIILGALSSVAIATARLYAKEGARLALAARRGDELSVLAADLKLRGAETVREFALDLAAADPATALASMAAALGGADVILLAYGALTDQAKAERDLAYAAQQLGVNFTSAAGWSLAAANLLETQNSGVLIVIGSVAGDRGPPIKFRLWRGQGRSRRAGARHSPPARARRRARGAGQARLYRHADDRAPAQGRSSVGPARSHRRGDP